MVIEPCSHSSGGRLSVPFLIGGAVLSIGILAIGSFILFSRLIDRTLFGVLIKPSALNIQRQMAIHLFEEDRFIKWQDPMSIRHFGEFSEAIGGIGTIVRINVFDRDRRLVFSDHPEDVGKVLANRAPLDRALQGEISFDEPLRDDISGEALSSAIELYIPAIVASGSVKGVVSLYIEEPELFIFMRQLYLIIAGLIFASVFILGAAMHLAFAGKNMIIRRQTKELSDIVDHAPVGIYIIDRTGVIETYNPKMVEIAGAPDARSAIGLNVFDLPVTKQAGLEPLFRDGLGGKPFEYETEYTSHLGNKRTWRHYRGVPLFSDDGDAVERLLVIVEDVTERKQFEMALAASVEERTRELRDKVSELEQFQKLTIGRELKMVELKDALEKIHSKKSNNDDR